MKVKYTTIKLIVSADKPVKEITQPIEVPAKVKKPPIEVRALLRSGRADKIMESIGAKMILTKEIIKEIIPCNKAFIKGPSPQSHHDQDS